MFAFDYRSGFLLYLFVMLALFLATFIYEQWRERRDAWRISDAHVARCPACNLGFIIPRGKTTGECPRCGRRCTVYPKG
ncbi:MAG: hypothetical protein WC789_02920 [Lentisphaeria bacterium]|jgi:hypothetical protein